MAKVLTDSQHYTDIADAIREKNGESTQYKPSEMASAIQGIQSGGGDIDALIDRSITEINSNVGVVEEYAFYECAALTTANFPNATSIMGYAFRGCSSLTNISFPSLINWVYRYAFYNCKALTTVNFPLLANLEQYAFYGCKALTAITLPLIPSLGQYVFYGCSELTTVAFPAVTSIGSQAFRNCSKLTNLTLSNAEAVCTLSNVNAFDGTPIEDGTGYVYVPDDLVDSYKAATNWSTYAAQIKGLSELPA